MQHLPVNRHSSSIPKTFRSAFLMCVTILMLNSAVFAAPEAFKEIPDGYMIIEGDIIVPVDYYDIGTTYETNLWTNGIVPYKFVVGSQSIVAEYWASDISFVDANPDEIRSPSQDFNSHFRAGDDLCLLGSDFNDNYGTSNTYTIAAITTGTTNTIILSAADALVDEPAGNTITIYVTPSVSPARQTAMLDAMSEWEDVANIDFIPRTTEADFIKIFRGTGNSSYVGMVGDSQTVSIISWGSKFIMAHELAHALGFEHEQSRPDRSTYVNIVSGNISQTECGGPCDHNFNIEPGAEAYPMVIPGVYEPMSDNPVYDFGSLMHYGECAFTTCDPCVTGCETILVQSPWNSYWQSRIGQRGNLSYWDAKTMSYLYPHPGWTFLFAGGTGSANDGTFLEPYTTTNWSTVVDDVPEGGGLVVLYPASFVAPGTYDKAMTIEAPVGGLILSGE